jgi:hypothetical protein
MMRKSGASHNQKSKVENFTAEVAENAEEVGNREIGTARTLPGRCRKFARKNKISEHLVVRS